MTAMFACAVYIGGGVLIGSWGGHFVNEAVTKESAALRRAHGCLGGRGCQCRYRCAALVTSLVSSFLCPCWNRRQNPHRLSSVRRSTGQLHRNEICETLWPEESHANKASTVIKEALRAGGTRGWPSLWKESQNLLSQIPAVSSCFLLVNSKLKAHSSPRNKTMLLVTLPLPRMFEDVPLASCRAGLLAIEGLVRHFELTMHVDGRR
jgi:hypothetical protein